MSSNRDMAGRIMGSYSGSIPMYHGERLNSVTHLLGLALAVVGSAVLIAQAVEGGDTLKIISFCIFSLTMIVLYAASTLYHSISGVTKERWAKVDHCAIYLLIAGTYTPFTLVTLHSPLGWTLFAFVWVLAGIGIAKELWWGRETVPSVPLYVLMGWCGIAAATPLMEGLRDSGWMWLLGGGLLYTVGIIFYALDTRLRHAHGIWHLFVLGGTASHYVTVLRFVA
ncbi:MAG TPA: hemolysin III family protein [Aquabacterium sp.]|uniref:PAQR family membrane homeostasis protein TrhA n=1 Tax=Aquabacterium sp. TaxID=1872578 RepID=UPI002DA4DE4C|nr:hemolysin III family protein [Aquabacterium sp.]HET6787429.1 hemolysin III family protein [Aquabacterium sp.]HEX5374364.1 hemolysin III family protein [Aquabacterium sp.]